MAKLICQNPDCKAKFDGKAGDSCPDCGEVYEAQAAKPAAAPVPASAKGKNPGATTRSTVSAKPTSLLEIASTAKRLVTTRSTITNGLGGSIGVTLQAVPAVDPMSLVKKDLVVPAGQRGFCTNPQCEGNANGPKPVSLVRYKRVGGQLTQELLDLVTCTKCGQKYNFGPIPEDTLIGSQYVMKGPIYIGGCGYVYVAFDQNVGKWVIAKALINSRDPDAMQTAVAEKNFLASLGHPTIVKIVNFVPYVDPQTGAAQQLIIMEFVDGYTWAKILKDRDKAGKGPLPVLDAIALTLGILPAFAYLHSQKPPIIYCDFKDGNAMQQSSQARLIDVGGCRVMGSGAGVQFTHAFCAPEVEKENFEPNEVSDIYSIFRTLFKLMFKDKYDMADEYLYSIPTPQVEPLFAQYECLYRAFLRGLAYKAEDRFQTVDEVAQQLEGVASQILAIDGKNPKRHDSENFGLDSQLDESEPGFHSLPALKLDAGDAAASLVSDALAVNETKQQLAMLASALKQIPTSVEAALRSVIILTDLKRYKDAQAALTELKTRGTNLRIVYVQGRLAMAQGDNDGAFRCFDGCYSEAPGEVVTQLALAHAALKKGDAETAERLYNLVLLADANFASAAFGLALCRLTAKDKQGAVKAYSRVPQYSIAHRPSVVASVKVLIGSDPSKDDLVNAATLLQSVMADDFESFQLRANMFSIALQQLSNGRIKADKSANLLGTPLDADELAKAYDAALKQCARFNHAEIVANVRTLISGKAPKANLIKASGMLNAVLADDFDSHRLRADFYLAAINQFTDGTLTADPKTTVLGTPLTEDSLRDACENALRQCARYSPDKVEALIDEANSVRRLTWF